MQCVFQVRRYLFRVCISRVWKQRERTNKEKREKKKIKRDKGKKLDIGIIFEREARLQPSDFSIYNARISPVSSQYLCIARIFGRMKVSFSDSNLPLQIMLTKIYIKINRVYFRLVLIECSLAD